MIGFRLVAKRRPNGLFDLRSTLDTEDGIHMVRAVAVSLQADDWDVDLTFDGHMQDGMFSLKLDED